MTSQVLPEEVVRFWVDEVGPKGWYAVDEALDAQITENFGPVFEEGAQGKLSDWLTNAQGALGYIILLDQFPRNMFRGSRRAFETDKKSLCAAKCAISKDWDLKIAEPQRQFFYLPLMHSESLADQDRCIRLLMERMPQSGDANLLHARAHREVIREFGRFPYRNDALGRKTTEHERRYMEDGGYGSTVRALEAA